jgi:hypothetical protein
MHKQQMKQLSSQGLKLSLVAVAGAAGAMPQDAAAEIVSATLNVSSTAPGYTGAGPDIYFSYLNGAIGTSNISTAINGVSYNTGKQINSDVSGNSNSAQITYRSIAAGSTINESANWGNFLTQLADDKYFGVRFGGPSSWNYGWLKLTRNQSAVPVVFHSAAMQTVAGVSIQAGELPPSAVPEIDPASAGSAVSLVAGVLAMVEQRRRRRVVPVGSAVT